jgi:signal transduction histidine kinase
MDSSTRVPVTANEAPARPGSTHLFFDDDNLKTRTWECPGRILVVDDDPAFRLLATRYLRDQNHIVYQAESGEQALEIARKEHPDVVLLDVNLPDVPGNEICCRLKADPELEHIIVVLVTASSDPEAHGLVLSSGANDFLTKPVSKFTLDARIRFSLKYRRAVARMRRTHAELERRVAERTAALTRANADLKEEISARNKAEADSKTLEDQLRQAQKMEAVGRLAGGVAHDFNNLLVVITGYADILAASLPDESHKTKAEQIGVAAQRASDLTRQLLAYSRRQVLQPRIISLSRTVEAMHRMLERLLSEDIQLVKILSAAGSVRADPGQLEQVLMNLAINARDAMPRGGTLTIETLDVELDETYMRRHGEIGQPGPYVMLALSDTGMGMPREVLERVFEPFFTTKEKGKGTGLGLSMVYGIVKQSGGNVFVYSEPGKGTTFKVYLPRVKAGNATESDTMPSTPEGARGETILVVEDEDAVRTLVCEVLQSAGYRTLDANGGEDAAKIADAHDGDIHMLVTDVVMPKMNGVAVARALTQKRPGLKVLYMSGYTENAVVHHGVLDPGIRYLQKPFMPAELIRKVRGILDNK